MRLSTINESATLSCSATIILSRTQCAKIPDTKYESAKAPNIPLIPNTELLKSLEGKVSEVYPIGDCTEPRLILDAMADGSRITHAI